MTTPTIPAANVAFDDFADNYDASLALGLQATGEGKDYFIQRRIDWLHRKLEQMSFDAERLLDYGCGQGDTSDVLLNVLQAKSYLGVDVSQKSLEVAQKHHRDGRCRFSNVSELGHVTGIDLAYCNGVFHHIPVGERLQATRQIFGCLRPSGLFAFWENNPWNPGTRWVMRRIPFDRDAVMVSASKGRQLLRRAGFRIESTDYLFIFPRQVGWLRPMEKYLSRLPIGGQYQIIARRPA